MPATVLAEILSGAAEKAAEAGIAIVGGHTIKSEEPIFGLAVVGTVHPGRVLANSGAQPGDVLILTKPIGLGIISTAAKNDQDTEGAIQDAIRVMATLNRVAWETLAGFEVHALTDVTGFGLLGHLRNMTAASKVTAQVWADAVPMLAAARRYVTAGIAPGGTRRQSPVPERLGDLRPRNLPGTATPPLRCANLRRLAGGRSRTCGEGDRRRAQQGRHARRGHRWADRWPGRWTNSRSAGKFAGDADLIDQFTSPCGQCSVISASYQLTRRSFIG